MTTTLNSTVHLGSTENGVDFDSAVLAAKAALDVFSAESIAFDFNQVTVTVGRFDSVVELYDTYKADQRVRASTAFVAICSGGITGGLPDPGWTVVGTTMGEVKARAQSKYDEECDTKGEKRITILWNETPPSDTRAIEYACNLYFGDIEILPAT